MQISVVIPTHNRSATIMRALASVRHQTSPADEVIVVDDGSSDGSATAIRETFPYVNLIEQTNQGVSAARNTGIKRAKYEWIALLDSDDEWLPNKLAAVRKTQAQNPTAILFHSDEIWIRNGVRINAMHKHAKYGGMIFEHCLALCVISPSAAVIHQSVFDEIGLFNEALPACEDYDLWLRLCHRYPVCYLDQPLINKYGGHADQLSRRHWGMDRFRIRALHDLMNCATLSDHQRQQTLTMLRTKLDILLNGARKRDNQEIVKHYQPLLEYCEQTAC